jgi:4-amino-4-deoxy-L-arabinose transferase-like glycosyltransferase
LLTKGLIGVAVVCTGYGLYVLLSRQLAWGRIARGGVALAAGALIASPWFLAMEHASPGYLYYYFVERHFLGYTTATQEHGHEAWYYYLLPLVGGSMPWAAYCAPGLWQAWLDAPRGQRRFAGPTAMLCCAVVGGVLFLSTSHSKLITYALPLYPPVAILAACAFERYFKSQFRPACETAFTWIFRLACAGGCVMPVLLVAGVDRYNHARSPMVAYVVAAAAAAMTLAALILMAQRRRPAALAVGTLWFGLLFVAIMTSPMQTLAEGISQRTLAARLRDRGALPTQVLIIGQHVGSLVFYLTPEQRRGLKPEQIREVGGWTLAPWQSIPPGVVVAMTDRAVREADNPVVKTALARADADGPFHSIEGSIAIAALPGATVR